MTNSKKNITFIINPIAGTGSKSKLTQTIDDTINKQLFDYKIVVSKKAGEIPKLVRNEKKNGAQIVVAVGGDGTVNEVARELVHSQIILGIIPTGSGNGLANFLKISKKVEEAVTVINQVRVKKIDTGTINGLFFVSVAGIGFDASVAKEYAQSKGRGLKTYVKSTIRKYFSYKAAKYKIKYNNTLIARRALLITFANSNQFGYNTSIAPKALIDDGFFDMCIMQKVPVYATPFVLPKLFTHRIHRSKYHETIRVSEAMVFRKRTSVIQIDGEAIKMKDRIIHVVNHKQSLNVLC
jgi:diacylglycerol kinase (ATP)